jgi:hypothetical protein
VHIDEPESSPDEPLNAYEMLAFDGELVTGADELAVQRPRRRPAGDLTARRLREVHGSGYVGASGYWTL